MNVLLLAMINYTFSLMWPQFNYYDSICNVINTSVLPQ